MTTEPHEPITDELRMEQSFAEKIEELPPEERRKYL